LKAGTQNHLKTKRLKRLLGIPLYRAVGILETIWLLCCDCCDEGNIGKFSDLELAEYLEWESDPSQLVRALADSGWTDQDQAGRPVIHDWLEHCPDFIRERVRKRRMRAQKHSQSQSSDDGETTYVTQKPDNNGQQRTDPGQAAACPVFTQPIPTQPIPTQPTIPPTPQKPMDGGGLVGRSVGNSEMTWDGVSEWLVAYGVERGGPTIATAKANKLTPNHVHDIIEHAQRQGYGPGAVVERIKNGLPTMAVNAGWTTAASPAAVAKQLDAKDRAKRAAKIAEENLQESWRMIREGREAGKSDEQIEAEVLDAGFPWPNPAKVNARAQK
jgi:hypothetical protein